LQSIVGTLLYYARAVDPSLCTAVRELGSVQTNPSENDIKKLERLLQYVSKHRNHGIRYYASTMVLRLLCDASYLCRPRARSVYRYVSYLGTTEAINVPITCGSKMFNEVVSSVAEAKLAGVFHTAQHGCSLCRILHELGYPQPPTHMRIDNTVAIGLAENKMNAKRSKAMDMRFFWVVDRIKQGQFVAELIAGKWNCADFFTKPLPRQKFQQFPEYLVSNLENTDEYEPKIKTKTITFPKEM
jgi:hypothetical protein